MSGSSIDYATRLMKNIERSIFLDLLQHTKRAVHPQPVVYVSMGGPFVQDQANLHAAHGWEKLISFDASGAVVNRQKFNRPVSFIDCLHESSCDLVADIANFFPKYIGDNNCVFWFDYTSADDRGQQLNEARSIAPMLRHGDVLKITMNANAAALGNPEAGSPIEIKDYRFRQLKNQLSDYFPATATSDQMKNSKYPCVLGEAFSIAVSAGLLGAKKLIPLTSFRYADGQQMTTFCGVVVDIAMEQEYEQRLDLEAWPFRVKDFRDVQLIEAPVLSIREKIEVDRALFDETPGHIAPIPMTSDWVRDELELHLGETALSTAKLVDQYRKYYRHYPRFVRMFSY